NKNERRRRAVVAAAALCKATPVALGCWSILATATGVSEAALYWDINGPTPGAGGVTPSGAWDNATHNWSADSTGSSATQAWSPGELPSFSAGSDATGQFTVNVSGTQIVSGLVFLTGQPVLAGAGLQFAGATSTINTLSGVSATIQSPLSGNS